VVAAFLPLIAAGFVATTSLHLIDRDVLMLAACAAALAGGGLWFMGSKSAQVRNAAFAVAFFCGFGLYGLVGLTDAALDVSPVKIYPVTILDKSITGGRSRSYNLQVSRWADQPGGDVSVPSSFYDDHPTGSVICLSRRSGALGLSWFEVDDCPPSMASPAPAPLPGSSATSASFYPPAAQRAGKEGRATVQCDVIDDMRLTGCRVLSEEPQGYGFGAAAVVRLQASASGLNPAELKGHATIQTTVNFRLAN
jgi:TonB family protein